MMEIEKWLHLSRTSNNKVILSSVQWGISYRTRSLKTNLYSIRTTRKTLYYSVKWSVLAKKTKSMRRELLICNRITSLRCNSMKPGLSVLSSQMFYLIKKVRVTQVSWVKWSRSLSSESFLSTNKLWVSKENITKSESLLINWSSLIWRIMKTSRTWSVVSKMTSKANLRSRWQT